MSLLVGTAMIVMILTELDVRGGDGLIVFSTEPLVEVVCRFLCLLVIVSAS